MEVRAVCIGAGPVRDAVGLVGHPPVYTAGSGAQDEGLVIPDRCPVIRTGRGGQFTYNCPGQRVAYVMLDVGTRFGDIRAFVRALETWLIETLLDFNIRAERRDGRVGIWVARPEKRAGAEDKIAAIGIRLRRWVSFHGVSLNVEPDLGHFDGIVPCGITDQGVTSLADLGLTATMADVDIALRQAFERVFSTETVVVSPPQIPAPASWILTPMGAD